MWRFICAVVLLPSLISAQSTEVAAPNPRIQQDGQLQKAPTLSEFTYYSKMRQGTSEKVAIEVVLVSDPIYANLPAILPLHLEMDGKDGLTVTRIEYPKTYKHTVQYVSEGARGANGGVIKFRVHAGRHSDLGTHILKGRLRFQVVTEKGALAPQETDVQIPLAVVEHNAKVTKSWPYDRDISKGELILLAPVLVLMFVPMALSCTLGFDWGCM